VDVGGYYLQFACRGHGAATVIVEDALGVSTLESGGWWAVIDEIETTTRVCVYDRAGLGLSDAAPAHPRTSQEAVKDLRTLLDRAPVPGPYILVGHSIGGLHALLFASQHPNDVAGIVLVNGAHPDQWAEFQALLPPEAPGEPARLSQLRTLQAQPASNPERLDVIASAHQVRLALARGPQPLGDVPLVVLTRSPKAAIAPFLPPEIAAPGAELWQDLQGDLAGLSSNSTHVIAAQAGHNIQRDEPQLVIDAILRILDEAGGPGD
jgi:pimeloyl-ACP methyl ester carboxylesterase